MILTIQQLVQKLKSARTAKNLSQRELANSLGIPQSHLSKIESGHVNIKLASFVKMARNLELEVMLIPRQEIPLVKNLMTSKEEMRKGHSIKPAYSLDDEKDEEV